MRSRWVLESAGMSLLFLFPYCYPLLAPSRIFYLHHRLPVTNLAGGLLLDFCGMLLVGVIVFAAVVRTPSRLRGHFAALFTAISTGCIANRAIWAVQTAASHFQISTIYVNPRSYFLGSAVLILAALVLSFARPGILNSLTGIIRLFLAGFAFSIFLVVPNLLTPLFVKTETLKKENIGTRPIAGQKKRLIWILFDELSYELVFDHPNAASDFPNFRALKSTSTNFSSLEPIGTHTDKIIASLLSGRAIDGMRSNSDGDLQESDKNSQRWRTYDPNATLFGIARAAGWRAGIVGWYNPYCRVFGSIVDKCFWVQGIQAELPFEQMGASQDKSAMANSFVIPLSMLAGLTTENRKSSSAVEANIADYMSIMNEAQNLIDDDSIDFIFIHLPIPHPPGIYDRQLRQLCPCGNYLDNLALADAAAGLLLEQLKHTARANQTAVIISSDHSWRTYQWRDSPGWSQEEEKIARAHPDSRPVFLIHFANQMFGREIGSRVSEMTENTVVAMMLREQISTPDQLDQLWSVGKTPR